MSMTPAERKIAVKQFVRKVFVEADATANLDVTDIDALIEDLDTYLDLNAAVINLAIRAGVRGKATTPQKAMGMAYCALKRAGAI